MWKGALVGAIALTVGMMPFASAQSQVSTFGSYEALAPSVPRITEANIARLKSALNLAPHQLAHWGPVEHALRALAKEQRDATALDELAAAGMLGKIRRLAALAAPLIHSLDETQRRDAMIMVRRMGYESLVATF
jgi:hypothetical protein